MHGISRKEHGKNANRRTIGVPERARCRGRGVWPQKLKYTRRLISFDERRSITVAYRALLG
jgi:hypothetical protein